MTISISVSVNGNYKCPVKVVRSDGTEDTEVVSGRGHEGPNIKYINHYHGEDNITTVIVGPEEVDNGESGE